MKRTLIKTGILLSILGVFMSCKDIYFTEAQTKNALVLESFPSELSGIWADETQKIEIKSHEIISTRWTLDSLQNKIDTTIEYSTIGDSIILAYRKPYYLCNYRKNNELWEMVVLLKQDTGDIHIYKSDEPELFLKDPKLKLKEAHYLIDGETTVVQNLNPDFKETLDFQSATFSGQITYKTIKNVVNKSNLLFVLAKDGRLFSNE